MTISSDRLQESVRLHVCHDAVAMQSTAVDSEQADSCPTIYLAPRTARAVGRHLVAMADAVQRGDWPAAVEVTRSDLERRPPAPSPADDRSGATVYVHRIVNDGVDLNGNTHKTLHCTDRDGAPLVLLLPGHCSYRAEPRRWYSATYGGRTPLTPYDGRVAELAEL
jgi:hypothetical protein